MNANNALPTLEEHNSKEQLPTIEELNNEQSLPTLDELNNEESLPSVEELNGEENLPTLDELNGEAGKEDIGVFERVKLEKEAQLGKKLGTVEAIAAHTPVVRHLPEMEAARQESVEQRLYEMQVDNSLEMVKLAKSIGLDENKIQEIVDEADSGKRTIGGFKRAANVPLMKERFRALVEPRMVERIKARQEARERLKNAKEFGTWGEIGKGALQMAAPLAELTNPLTIATEAGASVVKRTGRMGHNIYTLDENGKPVIAKDENGNELRGERGEWASVKALAGAAADAAVWVTPVVGKIIKTPLKLIANKTPGLNAALAGAAKGSIKALEKAQAKLETSAAGRLLLKTHDALGKLDDKVHFGSLPNMMAKSRVSEFLDNVVGLGATPEEREKFGEWVERITSAEDNLNLFLGMVGAWGVTAAATGGKAQLDIRRFRKGALEKGGKGREAIVGEFIGEDAAKKLSNEDLDYMARVISSKGLTVEKVDELMESIRTDKAETAARIDAGQTPDEVLAAWRAGRGDTSAVEGALKGLKGELEERRTITPEMEQALDERIALYSDGQESVARAIKEDFRKNLTDNKVFEDADALDEMVAMSARKFEPETRRLKIHDLRGSAMTDAEKVVGIKDLGIETVEDAEREGLVSRDQYGRLTGGATEAVKIVVHGTDRLKNETAEGAVSGKLAGEIIDFAETQMGSRERVDRTELIDSILDNAKGDESTAKAIMARLAEDDGRGTVAERVSKATIAVKESQLKARHPDADGETVRGAMVEPVETADGRMTTLADTMDVRDDHQLEAPRAPQGALEGVEQAARTKATKLEFAADGAFRCAAFPELAVRVSSAGVELNGFTPQGIADPAKAAEVAAVLAQTFDVAKRNGIKIVVDEVHRPVVEALIGEIKREGLAKTQAKLDTRAKFFSLLFKTTLGNGVTYDEASFRKALEETSNGRRFIDNHGDIYGLVDGNNVLHFNPGVINFNTPIHEYGHLALDTIKGINRKLWQQGMDLIKDSEYYRDIERQSNDAESPYAYMKGRSDDICDEALATLIGDRGEKLVLDKGLEAKLKDWLKEVWKAFKGAFGLGDLSDEQVEKMTLDEFVNVVNAELLSGREFGTKKKAPVTERSVKRYDESEGSGSNGLLRWRNDRGYLFAIPVDMERTQPGGKVVFATDDADITDYIQRVLNGIELRLSKSGKIYVKGQNGLPAELAEIFGKYPTIRQNDGIREELASALGNGAYANATVAELVDALKADRANYDEWVKAQDKGKSLEDQRQEAHYADEAAREEAEARERWENSGMGVLDYIRSRAEEGVPEFDLDWEIAREMARDFEEGRFAVGGIFTDGEAKFAARPAMTALGQSESW